MNFSASQWLASIIVDVLIKFVLVAGVGLLVTYGLASIDMLAMPAIGLSLLHFVCLFLGTAGIAMLGSLHIRLSARLQFGASLAAANVLFVGILVVLLWPGPNDIPRTADGPLVVALVLAATNLATVLIVTAVNRLMMRLGPVGYSDESVAGH